jgi:ABC-type phosphate transport system auxiliary subunit
MSADPQNHLELMLAELEEEERLISAERRRLQDRIDYFAGSEDSAALAELERRERELSDRRRELHDQIDGLRPD